MEAEHHFCDRLSIMFGPEITSQTLLKKNTVKDHLRKFG